MEPKEEPNMPFAIKISHEDFHVSRLLLFSKNHRTMHNVLLLMSRARLAVFPTPPTCACHLWAGYPEKEGGLASQVPSRLCCCSSCFDNQQGNSLFLTAGLMILAGQQPDIQEPQSSRRSVVAFHDRLLCASLSKQERVAGLGRKCSRVVSPAEVEACGRLSSCHSCASRVQFMHGGA